MGSINYPRVRVSIGGTMFAVESVTVHQNGYYHGDKATISLPLWGNAGYDLNYWMGLGLSSDSTTSQPVPILIYTGVGAADGSVTWSSTPLFDGLLNHVSTVFESGELTLECVDRTQLLVQYKLYQAFPNKTGAEIIEWIASQVGMTANVQGAAYLAGTVYNLNHMKLQHGDLSKVSTGWDMICYLARMSGNVAYVSGNQVIVKPNTVNTSNPFNVSFVPPTQVNGVTTWSTPSNVISMKLQHNLLAARDITVQVNYFHSKKGVPGKALAGPSRNRTNAAQSNYIYGPYPNLSEDGAQAKANELYRELTIHEYTLDFTAPADFTVTPYQTVTLNGASGPGGLPYFINQLSFSINNDSGGIMSVVCKTHPNNNDTNV